MGEAAESSALEVAAAFVALINARDTEGILAAVTPGSRFFVEGESPTGGRESLRDAWAGYFAAFPDYEIHVDESIEKDDAAYLVGHTVGSHVPEELESVHGSVIWRCEVVDGLVDEWSVHPSSPANRMSFGLGRAPSP
jgi:hypothetical protein